MPYIITSRQASPAAAMTLAGCADRQCGVTAGPPMLGGSQAISHYCEGELFKWGIPDAMFFEPHSSFFDWFLHKLEADHNYVDFVNVVQADNHAHASAAEDACGVEWHEWMRGGA